MNNHILCIKSMYENNEATNDYIKDIEDKIKSCGNTFSTKYDFGCYIRRRKIYM